MIASIRASWNLMRLTICKFLVWNMMLFDDMIWFDVIRTSNIITGMFQRCWTNIWYILIKKTINSTSLLKIDIEYIWILHYSYTHSQEKTKHVLVIVWGSQSSLFFLPGGSLFARQNGSCAWKQNNVVWRWDGPCLLDQSTKSWSWTFCPKHLGKMIQHKKTPQQTRGFKPRRPVICRVDGNCSIRQAMSKVSWKRTNSHLEIPGRPKGRENSDGFLAFPKVWTMWFAGKDH